MIKSQREVYNMYENVYLTLVKRFYIVAILLFTVIQQLYFSQCHQYLHLAVIFVYVLFSDFHKEKYRKTAFDVLTALSILGCAVVSIVEAFSHHSYSYLYFGLLLIAIIGAFLMFYDLFNCVRSPEKWALIKEKFSKDFSRSTQVVMLIIIAIQIILVVAFIGVTYTMFT